MKNMMQSSLPIRPEQSAATSVSTGSIAPVAPVAPVLPLGPVAPVHTCIVLKYMQRIWTYIVGAMTNILHYTRLAYPRPAPRPRPKLSSFKTKTKTLMSKTQDLQDQY